MSGQTIHATNPVILYITDELEMNSVISILETTTEFDLKLARYLKGEGKS